MQEGEDLLEHTKKIKALADQLACLEVFVRDEGVVMTLVSSYEYLISALETLKFAYLSMDYVNARLMHEVSKKREKSSQSSYASLMASQAEVKKIPKPRTCINCGKRGHFPRWRSKDKMKHKENAKFAMHYDEYAFETSDEDVTITRKWIMDL